MLRWIKLDLEDVKMDIKLDLEDVKMDKARSRGC